MERESVLYRLRRKFQYYLSPVVSNRILAKLYSRISLKSKINLDEPKSFNEKIQWLKLYNYPNNELVINASDKFLVRNYVEKKGLNNILVKLYGVWDKAEEIEWEKFPNKFVLKANHGCAYNIIVKNKDTLDKKAVIDKLNKWLKEDFGRFNVEKHYSKIKPKIICEEFLGEEIIDYKFFCFNGKPEFIYISRDLIHDRKAQMSFFDLNNNELPVHREEYDRIEKQKFPIYFNDMVESAKKLSKDFRFVRVDFFVLENNYYFSELTFTPSAGMMRIEPQEYDYKWGKLLDIEDLVKEKGKYEN